MIKGLAITPPIIGRICIGHMVERNGRRLPEKDDCFTITTQIQTPDGWMLHPLHVKLADAAQGKLRAIPVKLLFDSPDLNLRAQYSLFDRNTGRPLCVGDGVDARRVKLDAQAPEDGIAQVPCPSPDGCEFGRAGGCKLFGRLNVQIEGQDDALGSFIFRTTGYNSVRTLAARLHYFDAVSGGHARHLPLMLKLRGKSTTLSHRTPVYYADLTLREGQGLAEAVSTAKAEAEREGSAGVSAKELEARAREVLGNGSFEEGEEEVQAIVEEFYPEGGTEAEPAGVGGALPAAIVGQEVGMVGAAKGKTIVRAAKLTERLGPPPTRR